MVQTSILGRARLVLIGLATTIVVVSLAPPTQAASPGPSGEPRGGGSGAGVASLTGHWAVAGTSGFDITQQGDRIDGTSIAGIRFTGTIAGGAATFRFWEGKSFAKADPEDRGTGSFRVGPDGQMLFVNWQNEKPSKSSLDPVFTAVRVATIAGPSTSPKPTVTTWFTPANFQLAQWLAAALEYPLESVIGALILMSHPTPAQLHEDAAAYEAMLYLFRDWDRNHGIKPRPEP
jgi:hypothetical protein